MVPVIRSCQSPIWRWLFSYLHLRLRLHSMLVRMWQTVFTLHLVLHLLLQTLTPLLAIEYQLTSNAAVRLSPACVASRPPSPRFSLCNALTALVISLTSVFNECGSPIYTSRISRCRVPTLAQFRVSCVPPYPLGSPPLLSCHQLHPTVVRFCDRRFTGSLKACAHMPGTSVISGSLQHLKAPR